jgi:hypothetical protein
VDRRQGLVGFGLGPEEDGLLDLRRAGEAGEGMVAGVGAEHRAGVGERFQGADQQRPLPIEEANGPLAVNPPSH